MGVIGLTLYPEGFGESNFIFNTSLVPRFFWKIFCGDGLERGWTSVCNRRYQFMVEGEKSEDFIIWW